MRQAHSCHIPPTGDPAFASILCTLLSGNFGIDQIHDSFRLIRVAECSCSIHHLSTLLRCHSCKLLLTFLTLLLTIFWTVLGNLMRLTQGGPYGWVPSEHVTDIVFR